MRGVNNEECGDKLRKNFKQIAVRADKAAAQASHLAYRIAWSGDPFTAELAQCEYASNRDSAPPPAELPRRAPKGHLSSRHSHVSAHAGISNPIREIVNG